MGVVSSAFVFTGYILFSEHFVFPIYQRLFKTEKAGESSSQQKFELFFSFHCRLELQALEGTVGYVNQVIQSFHV